jgi:hypothetical protein
MALEIGNFISDLNAANPNNTDLKSQGDDHLRLLKKTLKASFPAVAGAVTKSHTELNAAFDSRVPVGGIIMWSGAVVNIPSGWLLCNGLSGTPNLLDRFVIGAGSTYGVGATGGNKDAIVANHSHSVTASGTTGGQSANHTHAATVNDPGHAHGVASGGANNGTGAFADATTRNTASTGTALTGVSVSLSGVSVDHNHNVTVTGATEVQGQSPIDANLPPYFALCFIMKSA